MRRRRIFYRGQKRSTWIITLVVTVLAVLLGLGIWLFYDLQQYVVYGKDGLELVPPWLQTETANEQDTQHIAELLPGDVEIVIEKNDYSGVRGTAGKNLQTIQARFIAAASVTEGTMRNLASDTGGYPALALELKPASGILRYDSVIPTVRSYDVNGNFDLSDYVRQFKNKDIWMIAQISALVDDAMPLRNTPLALQDAESGGIYREGETAWLDPYHEDTRAYLVSLMTELKNMGFDEILLSGLWLPESDAIRFPGNLSVDDGETAISALAVYLRGEADDLGLRLSAIAQPEALETGVGLGQNLTLFFKTFDRVAYDSSSDDSAVLAILEAALDGGDADKRIIPMASGVFPDYPSYIVK